MLFSYIRKKCIFVLILACLVFLPLLSNVYADGTREDIFSNEFDLYVRYISPQGSRAQSGKLGIMQTEAEYSYTFKLFDKLPVQLSLNPGYISLNNSTSVKLPSRLTQVNAGIEFNLPFFNIDNTFFRVELRPGFYGDSWDFDSGNFRLISRYGVIYKLNDHCLFVAGVGVYPRYEDRVWPIFGLVYKPNDKLSFNLVPDLPNITYDINKKVSLFLEMVNDFDEYYVNRNGSKVILQHSQINIGTGAAFKINKSLNSSLTVGTALNQIFKYRDSGGKVSLNRCGFYTEFRIQAMI